MSTYFIDFLGGNNGNTGLSFAQRKKDLSSISPSAGDTVRIMESGPAIDTGLTSNWTKGSGIITVSSSFSQRIDRSASWTASTNVTYSTVSNNRSGTSHQFAINGSFTTGLAAYITTPSSDYSPYQQVTFWIKPNAIVAANKLQIQLCSDAAGATPVNSLTIPAMPVANSWYPVTIDSGSALGASIGSVNLTVLVSLGGAVTLEIDRSVVAISSSVDAISYNSLIRASSNDTWYAIKVISGTSITMETCPNTSTNFQAVYGNTNLTSAELYRRETIKLTPTGGAVQSVTWSGSSGSPITISGGWTSAGMGVQDSETWLDGQIGQGDVWSISGNYITVDRIAGIRGNNNINTTGSNLSGNIYSVSHGFNTGLAASGNNITLTSIRGGVGIGSGSGAACYYYGTDYFNCVDLLSMNSNASQSIYFTSGVKGFNVTGTIEAKYNQSSYGILVQSGGGRLGTVYTDSNQGIGLALFNTTEVIIDSLTTTSNTTYGVEFNKTVPVHINNYTSSGNSTASMHVGVNGLQAEYFINNATIGESTKVVYNPIEGTGSVFNQRVYSNNEGGTINNNKVYTDGGNIVVDTVNPDGSGLDYTVNITGTNRTSNYPIKVKISALFFQGGNLCTFTARVKRTSTTAISAKLLIYANTAPGVTSDVSVDIDQLNTNYNTYSMSFTPTGKGACYVYLLVWSGTSTTDSVRFANPTLTEA